MIQITIPLSYIAMISEKCQLENQLEKKNSAMKNEKKDGIKKYTIADALRINSFKRGGHEDGNDEKEPIRFKTAGS